MNLLPAPVTLGLPEKFGRWRRGQAEAVLHALDSPKRFVVLAMPTGFGKSLVYLAASILGDTPTVFLTSTKGLQSQLVTDFEESGLVDIRGMNNYECREGTGNIFGNGRTSGARIVTCEEGPCLAGWKCGLASGGCDYFDQQRRARSSNLTVTNYDYWMGVNARSQSQQSDTQHNGQARDAALGKRGLLVLDEAHAAVDEVGDFLTIEIGWWECESIVGHWPDSEEVEEWRQWAREVAQRVVKLQEELGAKIKLGVADRRSLSHYRELSSLHKRLTALVSTSGSEWVLEQSRDRRGRRVLSFAPVWPGDRAEAALFVETPRVILTSATIRPKTLELLGVKGEEYEFLEYPSSFPTSCRPFVWCPTVRVRYDMDPGSARLWCSKIDSLIRQRLDRKGIMHCVSYQRRDYVLRYSEYSGRMLTHDSGAISATVDAFKSAGPGFVLLSPSAGTGFDFPGDECRYQIIGKIPFPNTQSKVLKARQERDPDFFAYVAAQNLVQMAGRGMRGEDDWCETIIIDDNWGWFYAKYKAMFPQWFRQSVSKCVNLPAPLTGR